MIRHATRWLLRLKPKPDSREALSGYISPEAVAAIAASNEPLNTEIKTDWFCCLLIQVRDDSPTDVRGSIEKVVPICLQNQGVILGMVASIKLVAFGMFGIGAGSKDEILRQSRTATEELIAALGKAIRIVAFSGNMPYGNFGSSQRLAFSIAPDNFDRFLAALLGTEFGGVTQFAAET